MLMNKASLLLVLEAAQCHFQVLMDNQDQITHSHQAHPRDRTVMAKGKLQIQNKRYSR